MKRFKRAKYSSEYQDPLRDEIKNRQSSNMFNRLRCTSAPKIWDDRSQKFIRFYW